jgi:hypothetical protein
MAPVERSIQIGFGELVLQSVAQANDGSRLATEQHCTPEHHGKSEGGGGFERGKLIGHPSAPGRRAVVVRDLDGDPPICRPVAFTSGVP